MTPPARTTATACVIRRRCGLAAWISKYWLTADLHPDGCRRRGDWFQDERIGQSDRSRSTAGILKDAAGRRHSTPPVPRRADRMEYTAKFLKMCAIT